MATPPEKIYQTQLTVSSLFLNKMGYRCHMPQAVVYTPETVGGLNFNHLGHEQGIQQVIQLLKHLHTDTTNGKLYRNLIDTYQVHAGIPYPILQDTQLLNWLPQWLAYIDTGLST